MWAQRFSDYVSTIDEWRSDEPRIAAKLERGLDRQRKLFAATGSQEADRNVDWTDESQDSSATTLAIADDVVDRLIDLAEQRRASPPPTVFLLNSGGAGSHWVEALMHHAGLCTPCSEVYVASSLIREFRRNRDDAPTFFDAVHMAHARGPLDRTTRLCNTAHLRGWKIRDLFTYPTTSILLVRNMVDTVMSRTFRKQNHRAEIAPSASDEEYLEQQIATVQSFYKIAADQRDSVDVVVRYEDVKTDPVATLGRLAKAMGEDVPDETLQRAFDILSPSEQKKSGQRMTNFYDGPANVIPDWAKDVAQTKLRPHLEAFGYPAG